MLPHYVISTGLNNVLKRKRIKRDNLIYVEFIINAASLHFPTKVEEIVCQDEVDKGKNTSIYILKSLRGTFIKKNNIGNNIQRGLFSP